jgi:hypothetical protein
LPKKPEAARNIALCVPQPLLKHEVTEEGQVKLLLPRFRAPWMQWLQKRLKKRPYIRLKLDEIGSAVWKLMDGQKTVHEIGNLLEQELGEKVQPVHQRLGFFLGMLKRNKFVTWEHVEAPEEK